jgi:fructokinase
MSTLQLGIDLGGSKIELIALDHSGQSLLRQRVPTPKDDYEAILDAITQLVLSAEKQLDAKGTVGIGTPGSLSRVDGCLRNSNSTCLNGRPMLQDLKARLQRPIALSNDANCFALSEATDGSGADAGVVFAVIIGTGTGAGIVVNHQVLQGPNGIAGEWGHNPLPWPKDEERPGPTCYCGKQGCIETFLSGPGMQNDYATMTGNLLSAKAIVAQAASGDRDSERVLLRYEDRMARSLAHVINIVDPDTIVLGGGMSNIERLYQNVPRLWGQYVFSDHVDTRLVAAKYGDSSGVRGAAWSGGRAAKVGKES